ncbi:hypothetical protein [Weissella cibaria]|uniref:hypothetical protein n=1 Tax=Weissella cibaria TaxID=137591 RepID=UPI001681238E|nr:hypothetical protein [Weissella cibaria]
MLIIIIVIIAVLVMIASFLRLIQMIADQPKKIWIAGMKNGGQSSAMSGIVGDNR